MNFSSFSNQIDGNNPSGIDIEYDSRFLELQRMAEGTPEQQYGDTIIEAKEADWNSIDKLCCQLLSEAKDIRLFCFYLQALTAKHGIIGFSHGCKTLFENMSQYWDSIFPALYDEDGDYDAYFRVNSISLLLSQEGVIKQLNSSILKISANKKVGINFRDAITLLSSDDKNDLYPGGKNQLIMDIKVAANKAHEEIQAIENSFNTLKEIQTLYTEKLPEEMLDFNILFAFFKPFLLHIESGKNIPDENIDISVDEINDIETSNGPSNDAKSFQTDISLLQFTERKDIEIVLEKVNLYFATYEPSHPAPLFIRRALRTLDMNFYEIMQDVSPNSMSEVENLFGSMFEDSDDD